MKKIIAMCSLLIILFSLSGCNSEKHSTGEVTDDMKSGDVIEINDKLFLTQTNDVYANVNDYVGKTIKYEGIYSTENYQGELTHYVIRYGPGCCGNDANVGFEVIYDGKYPQKNDWVAVEGTIEIYERNKFKYIRVHITQINTLDTRGQETVRQ